LNAEVNRILEEPEVIEQLARIGAVAVGGTPQAFGNFIAGDIERWKKVVKERGIPIE
jgi:tripartite-type tricarboxylate transporter receptor subunit TctC